MTGALRHALAGAAALALALAACGSGQGADGAPDPADRAGAAAGASRGASPAPGATAPTGTAGGTAPGTAGGDGAAAGTRSAPPASPATGAAGAAAPAAAPDWKALSFPAAGCTPREEWIARGGTAAAWDEAQPEVREAEVTGGGEPETITTVQCPAATSSWPQVFTVWDTTGPRPEPLLVSDEVRFRGAVLTPGRGSVTVAGPYVAEGEATCCPGHWARLTWTSSGGAFRLSEHLTVLNEADPATGRVPAVDLASGTLPEGTSHGVLRGLSSTDGSGAPAAVVVDTFDYFTGAEARAACDEDGVQHGDELWCNDVYLRDDDERLRTVRLAAGAEVTVLDEAGEPRSVAPAELASPQLRGRMHAEYPYWRIDVRDGQVVRLAEAFLLP
ncbi:hypothetical protein [Kineococcus sp. SYSU DK005]|uniref:hypothetical protein n=1 Tax=Kineococcus sp. SYSU DK005 TaxID=3383126 RepID=UPI003D7E0244